ncbi:hypothetical protein [Streptomyces sp. NPDC085937]|uniref:hypothetical protein n=1 Tax=Streptomyces sp. NPDC085937 TaxID=3365742 RepID=UPI0037D3E1AE
MNVLLCATSGTRLTEPVGRLDEMPEYPGRTSDDRGFLGSEGPCGTYVPHPDDVVRAGPHPDSRRPSGCRGLDGHKGPDAVPVEAAP